MKTQTILILVCTIVMGAAVVFAARAQTPPTDDQRPPMGPGGRPGGGPGMAPLSSEELDADKDGQITWQEFSAAWQKRAKEVFARLDANADSVLSADELPKHGGPRPKGGPEGGPEGDLGRL